MKFQNSIFLVLALMAFSFASINVMLSDQGTNLRNRTDNSLITLANISPEIWDSPTAGTLLCQENGTDQIINGSWNMMFGYNSSNPCLLDFNGVYYRTFTINGEAFTFTLQNGTVVSRMPFMSPLGMVNWSYLQNFPAACAAGSAITQLTTGVVCSPFISSETNWTAAQQNIYNQLNNASVNNSRQEALINSLNNTKSGIGDCPAGQVVQNITNSTPQCTATGGTGTFTNLGVPIAGGLAIDGGATNGTITATIVVGAWANQSINNMSAIKSDVNTIGTQLNASINNASAIKSDLNTIGNQANQSAQNNSILNSSFRLANNSMNTTLTNDVCLKTGVNCPAGATGNITGNGTSGYVPLYNNTGTINNSNIRQNSSGDINIIGYANASGFYVGSSACLLSETEPSWNGNATNITTQLRNHAQNISDLIADSNSQNNSMANNFSIFTTNATHQENLLNDLNNTRGYTGTCAAGQFVKNISNTTIICDVPAGGGTVANVGIGTGLALIGGGNNITATGTITADTETVCFANGTNFMTALFNQSINNQTALNATILSNNLTLNQSIINQSVINSTLNTAITNASAMNASINTLNDLMNNASVNNSQQNTTINAIIANVSGMNTTILSNNLTLNQSIINQSAINSTLNTAINNQTAINSTLNTAINNQTAINSTLNTAINNQTSLNLTKIDNNGNFTFTYANYTNNKTQSIGFNATAMWIGGNSTQRIVIYTNGSIVIYSNTLTTIFN